MPDRGNVRALFAMLVAVVFGSAAVVGLFQVITGYQAELEQAAKPADTVSVVVAARDLYPGVTIQPADLNVIRIEPQFLPSGAFLTKDYVVGQRPHDRILVDDVVRSERLANPETGEGLNALIPEGMRAISVEIADGAALSGQLSPGSFVDVVWTTTSPAPIDPHTCATTAPAHVETHTIMQAMFVLAVNDVTAAGRTYAGRAAGKSTVTLLATPWEASGLAMAEKGGDLQFTLRGDLDDTILDLDGVKPAKVATVAKFYSRPKTPSVTKRIDIRSPEETDETIIILGPDTETLTFPKETDEP